ncbi:hypothetical protein G7046_g109 [Stylonectria norvegica]|nr:hypothetical protein G7046_g109 [Stylonectria norvegica]
MTQAAPRPPTSPCAPLPVEFQMRGLAVSARCRCQFSLVIQTSSEADSGFHAVASGPAVCSAFHESISGSEFFKIADEFDDTCVPLPILFVDVGNMMDMVRRGSVPSRDMSSSTASCELLTLRAIAPPHLTDVKGENVCSVLPQRWLYHL